MLYVLLILVLLLIKSTIAFATMTVACIKGKAVRVVIGRAMFHAQVTATIAFFVRPEYALLLGLFDFVFRGLNEALVVQTKFSYGLFNQTVDGNDIRWIVLDTIINVAIVGVLLAR